MPKVTIAIATYNREQYLREAIASVLAQTFQDFQIIVFDNHSDYDVAGLVEKFNDKRISLVRHDQNIGGPENLQFAYSYPYQSEFVIIFHDDDVMDPDMLFREVIAFDANPQAIFVGTGLNFVNDDRKMFNFQNRSHSGQILALPDKSALVRLLLKDFDLGLGTIMYRSKYLNNFFFDKDRFYKWCDRPALVAMAGLGPVLIIKDKLMNYRIHGNQDSKSGVSPQVDPLFNLYKNYRDNLPQPLSRGDRRLFYYFSTNQIILSGLGFSHNFKEYWDFVRAAKKEGLFKLQYLNMRGLYYFLKVLRRLI